MARPRARQTIRRSTFTSLSKLSEASIEVIKNKVAAGNLAAAIRVMEWIVPKPKPVGASLEFKYDLTGSLKTADYARIIENHLMAGEISTDVALEAANALMAIGRVIESSELVARLEALEELAAGVGQSLPAPAETVVWPALA
jgi:electron transfer flavoprotein alpha subunit